jgi:hypothetical protein
LASTFRSFGTSPLFLITVAVRLNNAASDSKERI